VLTKCRQDASGLENGVGFNNVFPCTVNAGMMYIIQSNDRNEFSGRVNCRGRRCIIVPYTAFSF